jgi:hypothetical protein
MPLGLDHARKMRSLFDTPVLVSIPANSRMEAQYDLFIHPAPPQWTRIQDIRRLDRTLSVRGDSNEEISFERGNRHH